MEEVDIYGDLEPFTLDNQFAKIQEENNQLKDTVVKLEETANKFSSEIAELKKINGNLEVNISVLFKTAKAEINRKERNIADIRRQLDSLLFKRKQGKSETNDDSNDKDIILKQYADAKYTIDQKTRIISSLNRELENVRKELVTKSHVLKRDSAYIEDENETHESKYKKQRIDMFENQKQDKYRRDSHDRENRRYRSRSKSPDYSRYDSRRARGHLKLRFDSKRSKFRGNHFRSTYAEKSKNYKLHHISFNKEKYEYPNSSRSRSRSPSLDDQSYHKDRFNTHEMLEANRIYKKDYKNFHKKYNADKNNSYQQAEQFQNEESDISSSINNYKMQEYNQNIKTRINNFHQKFKTDKENCYSASDQHQKKESDVINESNDIYLEPEDTMNKTDEKTKSVIDLEEGELDSTIMESCDNTPRTEMPNINKENKIRKKVDTPKSFNVDFKDDKEISTDNTKITDKINNKIKCPIKLKRSSLPSDQKQNFESKENNKTVLEINASIPEKDSNLKTTCDTSKAKISHEGENKIISTSYNNHTKPTNDNVAKQIDIIDSEVTTDSNSVNEFSILKQALSNTANITESKTYSVINTDAHSTIECSISDQNLSNTSKDETISIASTDSSLVNQSNATPAENSQLSETSHSANPQTARKPLRGRRRRCVISIT